MADSNSTELLIIEPDPDSWAFRHRHGRSFNFIGADLFANDAKDFKILVKNREILADSTFLKNKCPQLFTNDSDDNHGQVMEVSISDFDFHVVREAIRFFYKRDFRAIVLSNSGIITELKKFGQKYGSQELIDYCTYLVKRNYSVYVNRNPRNSYGGHKDFTIFVEDQEIEVHRSILAEKTTLDLTYKPDSSFLADLCSFIAITDDHSNLMVITDFNYKTVQEVVQFFYDGNISDIYSDDCDFLCELLKFGHKYKVQSLIDNCLKLIKENRYDWTKNDIKFLITHAAKLDLDKIFFRILAIFGTDRISQDY